MIIQLGSLEPRLPFSKTKEPGDEANNKVHFLLLISAYSTAHQWLHGVIGASLDRESGKS